MDCGRGVVAAGPGLAMGQPGDRSGAACVWERGVGSPVSPGCQRAHLVLRRGSCCQPAGPRWAGPRAPSLGVPLWEVGTVTPAAHASGKFSEFTCTVLPSTFSAFGRKPRANWFPGFQASNRTGRRGRWPMPACRASPRPGHREAPAGRPLPAQKSRRSRRRGRGGNLSARPCRRTLSINQHNTGPPDGGRWRPAPGALRRAAPAPRGTGGRAPCMRNGCCPLGRGGNRAGTQPRAPAPGGLPTREASGTAFEGWIYTVKTSLLQHER